MFERNYQIDNSREADGPREKHLRIELTDREHMEKLERFRPKLVYKSLIENSTLLDDSTPLGKKYKKAKEFTKDTKVINLNEKDKSKSIKRNPRKANPKPDATAMASVQKEL
jgi:hypothetical protein